MHKLKVEYSAGTVFAYDLTWIVREKFKVVTFKKGEIVAALVLKI